MTSPDWSLSAAYLLHMLATVVWIGALTAISLLVLPSAQRALDSTAYTKLLAEMQKRLDPLGWFCLALLAGTGLFQMSASPNYQGFLAIDNSWAAAILVKHIVFALMIAISAYLTWFLLPGLQRSVLLQVQNEEAPATARLQRRSLFLLHLNLGLAVLVLALTALARAS